MQLNITTDYSLRIIIYLALNKEKMFTSSQLSAEMNIPPKYLVKIVRKLRILGYIESFQGINGGYKLKREPASITMLALLNDLEGTVKINRCMEDETFFNSEQEAICLVRRCFSLLQELVNKRLTDITIQSIIDKEEIK